MNPTAVGTPVDDVIFIILPKARCVKLNVSGFATKKKTSVE